MKMVTRVIAALSLLIPQFALAQDGGFMGTSEGVGVIAGLLVQIGVAAGTVVFVYGLIAVYKRGESPQTYPIAHCIFSMLAGTFLIMSSMIYAWSVNTASGVDWATDATMLAVGSHIDQGSEVVAEGFLGQYLPEKTIAMLFGFIYLIGLGSYLYGLYLFKDVGKQDSRTGGAAKAFWHCAGGLFVMNLFSVGCFLAWLLGLSMLCAA